MKSITITILCLKICYFQIVKGHLPWQWLLHDSTLNMLETIFIDHVDINLELDDSDIYELKRIQSNSKSMRKILELRQCKSDSIQSKKIQF